VCMTINFRGINLFILDTFHPDTLYFIDSPVNYVKSQEDIIQILLYLLNLLVAR
jgi:hypothetical protein